MYYDRIDLSKGIDVAKSNNSIECIICQYWFFNHGFKFQDSVWNGCVLIYAILLSSMFKVLHIVELFKVLAISVYEDRGYV